MAGSSFLAKVLCASARNVSIPKHLCATQRLSCLVNTKRSVNGQDRQPSKPLSLVGRDLLSLKNCTSAEIETLLWTAKDLKTRIKDAKQVYQPLVGKSVGMIFQKRSTRTRVSSETGMALLGGHALFLGPSDIHLGVNESIRDTARVLGRFTDLILARVYAHADLVTMANETNVPIINALSDFYHPLQALADLLTLQEHFGYIRGLKLAWVGDGNNIIQSLMMAGPKLGLDIRVATPQGYECHKHVTSDAIKLSIENNTELLFTSDPREAVEGADVIVTDTWVSMGQEEEYQRRMKDFAGFQVTEDMVKGAAPNWVFMHCLPRHQEEVSDEIFYDKQRSIVWDEAENRKWTVMSVMLHLLVNHSPTIPKLKLRRE